MDATLAARVTPEVIDEIVGLVPDVWMSDDGSGTEAPRRRDGYRRYLTDRVSGVRAFVEEAARVR